MEAEQNSRFSLPNCFIPERIRENYEARVKKFYKNNDEIQVENFSEAIKNNYNIPEIRLIWDEERGLANISNGGSCGLDLEDNLFKYVFHNVHSDTPFEKPLFFIAEKYIELLNKY